MAEEIYSVLLKSNDGTGTTTKTKLFYVNWESFLPRKYKHYILKCDFRSDDVVANDGNSFFLTIKADGFNIAGWNSKTKGKSQVITIAEISAGVSHRVYIPSYDIAMRGVMIEKPTENALTITICDFTQTTITNAIGDWQLFMELIPVKEEHNE